MRRAPPSTFDTTRRFVADATARGRVKIEQRNRDYGEVIAASREVLQAMSGLREAGLLPPHHYRALLRLEHALTAFPVPASPVDGQERTGPLDAGDAHPDGTCEDVSASRPAAPFAPGGRDGSPR